jgi:hypothetical protein
VSFHLFFTIMRTILWAAQLPLEFALFFLTETPVFPFLCRIFAPQQLCCSLFLRKISASPVHLKPESAASSTTAAVFALEAGCEGWDDVLREAINKAMLLVAAQLLRLKVAPLSIRGFYHFVFGGRLLEGCRVFLLLPIIWRSRSLSLQVPASGT